MVLVFHEGRTQSTRVSNGAVLIFWLEVYSVNHDEGIFDKELMSDVEDWVWSMWHLCVWVVVNRVFVDSLVHVVNQCCGRLYVQECDNDNKDPFLLCGGSFVSNYDLLYVRIGQWESVSDNVVYVL